MSLTDAQYTTLANHIRANIEPEVVAALAIRNDTELARLYNLDSSFYVWRTSVTPDEYRGAMVWTEVDTLNAGNARIWEWITNYFTGNLDASDANVRQGIADAFGAGTTTRANLLALGKRLASLYEEVFATGTGTEATPGTMVLQGPVTTKIIGKALNEY
jgi:hypothetical protein